VGGRWRLLGAARAPPHGGREKIRFRGHDCLVLFRTNHRQLFVQVVENSDIALLPQRTSK
jgi:hypothetical protein